MPAMDAEGLLRQCLAAARLDPRLLGERRLHALFALSATAAGRRSLAAEDQPLLGQYELERLARWQESCGPQCAGPRVQLLARHALLSGVSPPPAWERARRLVRVRAGVKGGLKVDAVVAASLSFGNPAAALMAAQKELRPEDAVVQAFVVEIAAVASS